jgi:hypothetical protein
MVIFDTSSPVPTVMKKNIFRQHYFQCILTFFLLFIGSAAFSQADSLLNQFDDKGKKQGYWLYYLDDKLNPADLKNATYYGFDLYDHGQNLRQLDLSLYKKLPKTHSGSDNSGKSKPLMLEGEFTFSNPGYKINITYKDGHLQTVEKYYLENKIARYRVKLIDYTRHYQTNDPGSYYWEVTAHPDSIPRRYWYIKIEDEWQSVKIDPKGADSTKFFLPKKKKRDHPKSIIDIGIGAGPYYGIAGGNLLLGYKGTGLLLCLGYFDGLAGGGIYLQVSNKWAFFNVGYGVTGKAHHQDSEFADNIYGKQAMVGVKLNLERSKKLFLLLGLGYQYSSFYMKTPFGRQLTYIEGPTAAVGLGFRISFSKSDYGQRAKK